MRKYGISFISILFIRLLVIPVGLYAQVPAIDKEVHRLMKEGHIPGLSLVMVQNGRQVIKSFGYADVKTKEPVTPSTLFELGSCSKAFTALAAARLQSEQRLDTAASVAHYLPWFRVMYRHRPVTISIRQLLHHTSGIPWNTIALIPEDDKPGALERTVRQLTGLSLDHKPGTTFEYATVNYDILALVIQTITGQPFEEYITQQVFTPLELTHTSIGRPASPALLATGYKIGFFRAREYNAPRYAGNNAAGYVISNAQDMLRWLNVQMGGAHQPWANLARLTQQRDETVPLHEMSAYASGWQVALDGTGDVYHSGLNPNFTSYLAFRPAQQLGVAVLANANSPYTVIIGNTVMKLLAGEAPGQKTSAADNGDKTYSFLCLILGIYMLVVLGYAGRIVMQLVKGGRRYTAITSGKALKLAGSFVLLVPVAAGIYLLPRALAGFTWPALLVWTPKSFTVLLYLLVAAVTLSYLVHLFSTLFPEQNVYRKAVPGLVLMSVLSGLANVVIIVMVTAAIDTSERLAYRIFYYTLALCIYLLGRRTVQVRLIRLTRGLVYDLTLQLTGKIFATSYQKFEQLDRGRIYTTLNDDIKTIGESTNMFMLLITSVITACGAFLFLSFIAFWATLLTVALIVALATLYSLVAQRTVPFFHEARDERSLFMKLVNGMIDGYKELSLRVTKKGAFKEDVAGSAGRYRNKLSIADIKFVNAFLVGESLLVVLLGLVAFGMPAMFPDIPLYTLMSFVIVLLYLIGPINGILTSLPAVMQFRVAWDRIRHFLADIPGGSSAGITASPAGITVVEKLQLKDVHFRYKDNTEAHAFEVGPLNLEACKGEIVFIIGGNGSGKTTLAKLLTGLYLPDEGAVLINDQPGEAGEYISAVFSPCYLFEKLYDIDTGGREEDITRYLKLLDLEGKVTIDNNRFSTLNLSGGQRKRLALLQCYLEDAPVYLFDEWAADQDPEYRNFFYRVLLPDMKRNGKIVIAITHDDHYFDVADKILKMKQGKLEVYSLLQHNRLSLYSN